MTLRGRETLLSRIDVLAFAFVAGTLATFRIRYVYGLINQLEHLPPVFHMIDPRVLASDWHVAQNLAYGPRFFYYHLLAALGEVFPLPTVAFAGTLLSNVATLYLTFLLGRALFRDDRAALFGAVLVAGVHSMDLGGATFLTWEHLVQASVSEPFALAAILLALQLRPVGATILAAVSAFLHPVVGLEAGGLALGVVVVDGLMHYRDRAAMRRAGLALGGIVLLAILAYGVFLGQMDPSLTNAEFFRILVHFRNPHHYVPSAMEAEEWYMFGFFLPAAVLAWRAWWFAPNTDRGIAARVAVLIGFVLGLMIVGYVFVEVIPVRFIASMQVYRNLFILKWLGLVLAGYSISRWVFGSGRSRLLAAVALFGTGAYEPVALAASQIGALFLPKKEEHRSPWIAWIGVAIAVAGFLAIVFTEGLDKRELLFVSLLTLVALWFVLSRPGWLRPALPVMLALIHVPLALSLRHSVPFLHDMAVLTMEDAGDKQDRAAFFARDHLPQDAIFVVSPLGGRFRVASQRAIVVDFKAFVFQDSSVAQWMQRITDTFGTTGKAGFAARSDLEEKYKKIDDHRLAFLRSKYDATYALLYRDTPTAFPVVYKDDVFKIVTLNPAAASRRARPAR